MTESSDYESVQVFIGVDVGKDTHHAVAVNRSGKRLFDKALPNDENKLRALISDLKQHGQILLVVDQPASIGALPVTVARSEGVLVGYLPGLAMRRIADLHAGEAKTDARDAAIIAEAARTLPHTLRTLKLADEQIAELSILCGFDDDLAAPPPGQAHESQFALRLLDGIDVQRQNGSMKRVIMTCWLTKPTADMLYVKN